MPSNRKDLDRVGPILVYTLPLILYALLAIPLGIRHREMMNADAMCYIRRAGYLLHGDFYYFLSEHWSLMISWLMAPLQAIGMDGLYAARIVTVFIGALYMLCFTALARRLLAVHWIWHLLAGMVIAPFIASVAIRVITPDLLLGAWLVLYMLVVLDPRLPDTRGRQFLAGVVGGVAYLAKAFAFPFVIVSLPMTLLIHAVRKRSESNPEKKKILGSVALAYARGLLGFFLIAGPWIGALSWKYGHLTFGSSGAAAHGVTGSKELPGFKFPTEMSFALPPGPYIAPMETAEKAFPRWSPFASRQHFTFQLHVIKNHALMLRRYLSESAPPYTLLIVMPLAVSLLLIRSPQRWKLAWMLLTLALFLGPFLLVVVQYRYLNPHVVPLALLLCMMLALEWRPGASDATAGGTPQRVPIWRAGL
ncbi:MAG TPA: hypothetical protein VGP94_14600, partial [Tepidisphaeraceae bacterium]|nr:hypothetical protein [Tepidisphaeraceae bacterium]